MQEPKLSVACIEVTQPIGTFYIAAIDYRALLRICYADVRSLADADLDTYLGIQRILSPDRVRDLQRYVNAIDATFPTSIILAIPSQFAEFHAETSIMEICDSQEVAKIIDGQHRIEGLKAFSGEGFHLNVTLFIDMDIEDQAMVFATINLAQTKVNRSLVYDLFDLTTRPSPQKASHNIAKLLNSKPDSPFYHRIKILGVATETYQTLTQATVVESLIRMVSGTSARAEEDRELLKRKKKPPRATPDERNTLVFRDMFLDDRVPEIARVVWSYFEAIRAEWPEAWSQVSVQGNMLPRTNGFRAFMRFLPQAYLAVGGPPGVPKSEAFARIIQVVPLEDEDFNTLNYPPGTGGESRLYQDLRRHTSL